MKRNTKYFVGVAVLVVATLSFMKIKKSVNKLDTIDVDTNDDFMLLFLHNIKD